MCDNNQKVSRLRCAVLLEKLGPYTQFLNLNPSLSFRKISFQAVVTEVYSGNSCDNLFLSGCVGCKVAISGVSAGNTFYFRRGLYMGYGAGYFYVDISTGKY